MLSRYLCIRSVNIPKEIHANSIHNPFYSVQVSFLVLVLAITDYLILFLVIVLFVF